jgi:hypothetical protein
MRLEVNDNTNVGGNGAATRREDRIQIELANFRKISDQLRDRDDDACERCAIDRSAASHAAQDLRRRDSIEHRERVGLGRGREAKGDILEHLDQHSAESEGDHLAEARITKCADDNLVAAGEHLLDEHAAHAGVGFILLRAAQNHRVSLLGFRSCLHPDHHGSRIALVQDVRRNDFHHHRETDFGGDARRLRAGSSDRLFRLTDSV